MNHTELEEIYAALALQTDAVGADKSELLLATLVLLLAHQVGNTAQVQTCIKEAATALS
ncbi:DUF2783 domain-containing protein [uncultured Sulfitobacter sp.]|uniref:DUF2783 domain-containing protein n=1 Tax=uncultured Sulfitobacter sp. TaxID=191468 RepID=UPI002619BD3D|nr:DUF2783 domain-containing protein [uncultured Sulfitobacter sp.]